jgi:hypothetical protein
MGAGTRGRRTLTRPPHRTGDSRDSVAKGRRTVAARSAGRIRQRSGESLLAFSRNRNRRVFRPCENWGLMGGDHRALDLGEAGLVQPPGR